MNQNKQKLGVMSNKKTSQFVTRFASYSVLVLMTALIFIPILWMISTALKSEEDIWDTPIEIIPSEPTLYNFKNLWSTHPFLQYLENSLIVVCSATLISVCISTDDNQRVL